MITAAKMLICAAVNGVLHQRFPVVCPVCRGLTLILEKEAIEDALIRGIRCVTWRKISTLHTMRWRNETMGAGS